MLAPKSFHIISFVFGIFFLLLSFYLAFFVKGSYFYTSFALGSWLVFDFIDYKLNNTSILSYFYSHKHRYAFFILFLVSFFACFTVDFVWGVQILKAWIWVNYTVIQYIRMYLIMNISFVLSMYELYRIILTLLKSYIPDINLFNLRFPYNKKRLLYVGILFLGILFFISPIFVVAFNAYDLAGYIMVFPFIAITLISDSITYFTGGEPILEELIRFNRLKVTSIALTVLSAFIVTEGLNLFGREWKYLRMPFYNVQVLTVPLSVLVGWIPLIIGLLSMVNMTKHLTYISENH